MSDGDINKTEQPLYIWPEATPVHRLGSGIGWEENATYNVYCSILLTLRKFQPSQYGFSSSTINRCQLYKDLSIAASRRSKILNLYRSSLHRKVKHYRSVTISVFGNVIDKIKLPCYSKFQKWLPVTQGNLGNGGSFHRFTSLPSFPRINRK